MNLYSTLGIKVNNFISTCVRDKFVAKNVYETYKCDVVVAVCIDVLKLFVASLRSTCLYLNQTQSALVDAHTQIH